MSKTKAFHAFVLRKKQMLEKDVSITLYTKEMGKLVVIGKGTRSLTSRRIAALESGNYLVCHLTSKNDYWYLHQVHLKSIFLKIKASESKSKQLLLFLYIIDRLSPEGQDDPLLFEQLFTYIKELDKGLLSEQRASYHLSSALMLLGYSSKILQFSDLLNLIQSITNKKIPSYII